MKQQYILSFGMSNYLLYGGGTNLAVQNYQEMYYNNGITYIYVSPYLFRGKKYMFLDDYWNLIINGKEVAVCNSSQLIASLNNAIDENSILSEIHIHHCKYTNLDAFSEIIRYFKAEILMFIHDYTTVCDNFTLLNENDEYCGDGGCNQKRCIFCTFYEKSISKVNQYKRIWDEFIDRIIFVFPSEIARKVWLSAYPEYYARTRVVPHQKLVGKYIGNKDENGTTRIAYIGSREKYKGWQMFERIFQNNKENQEYEWFYLGTDKIDIDGIHSIYVDNKIKRTAMIDSLRNNKIDAVVLWSICKETYSYTYFECLASNVYVITNPNSGNIYEQVMIRENGIVITEEKIANLFETGEIHQIVRKFKNSDTFGPYELIINDELCIKSKELRNINAQFKYFKSDMLGHALFVWDCTIKKLKDNKYNDI